MTDYVVTGLVKRRAELTGEIERTHEGPRSMLADLEARFSRLTPAGD